LINADPDPDPASLPVADPDPDPVLKFHEKTSKKAFINKKFNFFKI
jgi:hypothetical protein